MIVKRSRPLGGQSELSTAARFSLAQGGQEQTSLLSPQLTPPLYRAFLFPSLVNSKEACCSGPQTVLRGGQGFPRNTTRYLSFINAQKLAVRPRAEFDPWTIDGKQLPPDRLTVLSVWKKGAGGWQWISHPNLASIP